MTVAFGCLLSAPQGPRSFRKRQIWGHGLFSPHQELPDIFYEIIGVFHLILLGYSSSVHPYIVLQVPKTINKRAEYYET